MIKWLKVGNTILLASALSWLQSPGQCQTHSPHTKPKSEHGRLQHAIDQVFINPELAEQELKRLPRPTAKAYLAFLYLTKKVTIPHAQKRIDYLMHSATSAYPNNPSMQQVEKDQVHYKKVLDLLVALRFISEADGCTAPTKLFEQYPEDCLNSFQAYYFSSMERPVPFEMTKADDIFNIPQVKEVSATLDQIYGDPRDAGTYVYGVYRNLTMARIEASLAPQIYLHDSSNADLKVQDKEVTNYLQLWAMQELWNQQTNLKLQREIASAVKPLVEHYRRRFKISAQTASAYAKAALRGYSMVRIDNFSHEQAKIDENDLIYKTFGPPGLSLESIKQKIGQRVMTEPELIQALHFTILSGGSLETIDWLIKQGAPLKGGVESPLFSAVMRPDVAAFLMKAGADTNEPNLLGKTALIQCAQYNALATIKLLLQSGVDINHAMLKIDDNMPKEIASSQEINYVTGSRTALMYAAAFSDTDTIEYLLSKGADKTAVDSAGWRPVKFLAWNTNLSNVNRQKMTKLLR